MEKRIITDGLVSLSTDLAHMLHDSASKEYTECRRITVKAQVAERYVELTVEDWGGGKAWQVSRGGVRTASVGGYPRALQPR